MDNINEKDIYEIRLASLISNIDKDVVIELYEPLIGSEATIVYLTLVKQKRNEDGDSAIFSFHSRLFNCMKIDSYAFSNARKALEAVGLLRTYVNKNSEAKTYVYVLYAPKNPRDFFDDVLFKGLLIEYIGEKETKRLASHYHVDLSLNEEFVEISASFVDVFNPNYDDAAFRKNINETLVGHDSGRVKILFNIDLFFRLIEENSSISRSTFVKKDIREIERIATLFGLDEKSMANIIMDVYKSNMTPHIDYADVIEKAKEQLRFPSFKEKVIEKSKETKVGKDTIQMQKIRMMAQKTPAEYLSLLQGHTKPARADVSICQTLSDEYHLSDEVINALITFALEKCNNILSRPYCEKIASSLVREKIETALDAMNYLYKTNFNKDGKAKSNKIINENKEDKISEKNVTEKQADITKKDNNVDISDQEVEDILQLIESKRNNKR